MAEVVGLEPTRRFRHAGFQDRCLTIRLHFLWLEREGSNPRWEVQSFLPYRLATLQLDGKAAAHSVLCQAESVAMGVDKPMANHYTPPS